MYLNYPTVKCGDGCLTFQGYNRLSESKGWDVSWRYGYVRILEGRHLWSDKELCEGEGNWGCFETFSDDRGVQMLVLGHQP